MNKPPAGFFHRLDLLESRPLEMLRAWRCEKDCVETAPAVFQLDADGKSEVVNATGAADSSIVVAARSCPVKAITVVDGDTQLFPVPKK